MNHLYFVGHPQMAKVSPPSPGPRILSKDKVSCTVDSLKALAEKALSDLATKTFWNAVAAGLLDGLLGVAGMTIFIVIIWIILSHSRRLAPVRKRWRLTVGNDLEKHLFPMIGVEVNCES